MEDLLQAVRSILSITPQRWQSLVASLPVALLKRPPATGEWPALDCLAHLVDTERVFVFRVQCFLAGQDFPAFNPDEEGTKPNSDTRPETLAQEFARLREKGLEILGQVTPADIERRVNHQELGLVTLKEMLNEWAAHDLMHTVQAEQALMQPFIRECGPWQKSFRAHFVG